jgi:hypothetical protein
MTPTLLPSLTDEELEALGKFFVHHDFHQRNGITFAWFLWAWENGTWKDYIA